MSLLRTSTLAIARSGVRSVRAPQFRAGSAFLQTRNLTHDKNTNDLGGPYGQTPRPERPGGVDAIRRNWMRVAAGVLLVVGLVTYAGKKPEKVQGKIEDGKQAVGLKS